ncbi:hypothetical protein DE146DRAFT_97073 [Phaeosphaeria sp. MPI-PUGE-AT-0046c]|nr:hypothetical protein DE146DRAFT_97073 [Phaeosphaeria sp. MPI-PUGE-AT-0046c]
MASWKIVPESTKDVHIENTSFIQSRKFFAVDDSGSTAGAIARRQRQFVDRSRARHANAGDAISLWGSGCDYPRSDFDDIRCMSRHGGTMPTTILRNTAALETIRNSDVWFLLTDGEIGESEVTRLARMAMENEVLNVPLVFVITGYRKASPSTTDISVGISFFASATDTLILFKDTESGVLSVIAGKGRFASMGGSTSAQDLESWEDLQSFQNEQALFARCEELEVNIALAKYRPGAGKGVALGREWEARQDGPVRVDLDLLLEAGLLSDPDLFDLLEEDTFNTLAIAYKTRDRIADLRALLQKQKIEQVAPKLEDVSAAGALIAEMGDTRKTDRERKNLQERLRLAHAKNREHYQALVKDFATSTQARTLRERNQLVDGALRALASIEAASFSAEILSRKSNRARRAEVVQSVAAIDMANLDLEAPACGGFCLVCCDEDVIMSICFKEPEPDKVEDNTTDFALNFPLAAGAATKNIDLVSSQHICFQCAILAPDNLSIYREQLLAVIPALQYTGSNKKYINDQLYMALTAKLATGAAGIAQLFMSILQELLTTKAWTGAGLSNAELSGEGHVDIARRRGTLQWMLEQLLEGTRTREDFKETGAWVQYPQALSWALKDFEANGLASFVVTYPAAGFNNLLALGTRVCVFNEEVLRQMRSAKVIHSIAAKYLADLQVALNSEHSNKYWWQRYLEVIYQDFNGPLVPRDRGTASLVVNAETFKDRLAACIKNVDLDGGEAVRCKVQLILFWLMFKQKGHCTAQTFFTRIRETEPLAAAVLSSDIDVPASEYKTTLLSIFASQNTNLINTLEAARHTTAMVPFANPYSASVLRCGVPSCKASFSHLKDAKQVTGKSVNAIRTARTKHLVSVFGVANAFESSSTGLPERTPTGNPPTSLHMNLHASMVRQWASCTQAQRRAIVLDVGAREEYILAVRQRLCDHGRGNIFHDNLDHEARILLPSLFAMLKKGLEMEGKSGEDVSLYEHDFDKNSVEERIKWEMEAEKEGLDEWELA